MDNRIFFCSLRLYLGRHVVGVANHHGTGEVLVEVIHVLAHSATSGGERKGVSHAESGCGGVGNGWREVLPAAEARRDADVVKEDEMLHQLAETNSSRMRADWNCRTKV